MEDEGHGRTHFVSAAEDAPEAGLPLETAVPEPAMRPLNNGLAPYTGFHRREMLPAERAEIKRHASRIWRRPLYGTVALFLSVAWFARWFFLHWHEPDMSESLQILPISLVLGLVSVVLMFFYFLGSLREAGSLRRDARRGVLNVFVQVEPGWDPSSAPSVHEIETLPSAERQWSIDQEPAKWRSLYPARVHDSLAD